MMITDYRYAELCPPASVNKGTIHSYDETTANNLKNAAHDRETSMMVRTKPLVWFLDASQPRNEHLTPAACLIEKHYCIWRLLVYILYARWNVLQFLVYICVRLNGWNFDVHLCEMNMFKYNIWTFVVLAKLVQNIFELSH